MPTPTSRQRSRTRLKNRIETYQAEGFALQIRIEGATIEELEDEVLRLNAAKILKVHGHAANQHST